MMAPVPRWITDRAVLREIGLKLETVRRYGRAARWISCRECGEGLVALWCTDCGWTLEAYYVAYAHLAGLGKLPRLCLFACPNGCNAELIEQPKAVLQAQAEAATRETMAKEPRKNRRSSRISS